MSVPTGIALAAVELASGDAMDEEKVLVARARAGDRVAFEALVRQHADHLYAVVLRFSAGETDAEEATQEAFVRACRAIGTFRGQSRFFTWLYRIGVNEAKRIAERRPAPGTLVSLEERPVDDVDDQTPGPESRAEHAELRTGSSGRCAACPRPTAPPWSCATSRACRPPRPPRRSACARRPSRAVCTAAAWHCAKSSPRTSPSERSAARRLR